MPRVYVFTVWAAFLIGVLTHHAWASASIGRLSLAVMVALILGILVNEKTAVIEDLIGRGHKGRNRRIVIIAIWLLLSLGTALVVFQRGA